MTTNPTRRAVLAVTAAAAVTPAVCAGEETEAARLARAWAEAMDAYHTAQVICSAALDKAEPEFPDHGMRPEPPEPERFASEQANAEHEQLMQQARDLANSVMKLADRRRAEGKANPAYAEALKAHEKTLEEWEMLIARKREIERKHGLDRAEKAADRASEAKHKATHALMAAPIASPPDALAVLCAVTYWADLTDAPEALTNKVRHRIAPWLPAAPKAWAS